MLIIKIIIIGLIKIACCFNLVKLPHSKIYKCLILNTVCNFLDDP